MKNCMTASSLDQDILNFFPSNALPCHKWAMFMVLMLDYIIIIMSKNWDERQARKKDGGARKKWDELMHVAWDFPWKKGRERKKGAE
jgi:hypothetical protein